MTGSISGLVPLQASLKELVFGSVFLLELLNDFEVKTRAIFMTLEPAAVLFPDLL